MTSERGLKWNGLLEENGGERAFGRLWWWDRLTDVIDGFIPGGIVD